MLLDALFFESEASGSVVNESWESVLLAAWIPLSKCHVRKFEHEDKNKVNIIIIPNPELESPKYKLTRYRDDNDDTNNKSSYELIEKNNDPVYDFEEKNNNKTEEPTVKGIKPLKPIPIKKTNIIIIFFKAIKNIFFGNTSNKQTFKRRNKNYNPNYKGKKFNKNYRHKNHRFSRNKNNQTSKKD